MKVFGDPLENAVEQMKVIARDAEHVALMADHHLGYSMPIGGVALYKNKVSPTGVGFDIACGNKAVELDISYKEIKNRLSDLMDEIYSTISFGVGIKNNEKVECDIFDNEEIWLMDSTKGLKDLAASQLGTVGSGNHYVDLFVDGSEKIWCGVHFGSRGLGHKITTHFLKRMNAIDAINAPACLIDSDSADGQEYIEAMNLAGNYAYAGRDWVCSKVAEIIGTEIIQEVHNHHNYMWKEIHFGDEFWVVRKGSTPLWPGQKSFIGSSMAEPSLIVEGKDNKECEEALRSTVHGAGRIMSRTRASGKKKWKRLTEGGPKVPVKVSEGEVTREMMMEWVDRSKVELRGAGTDESPHCYKRLSEVILHHEGTLDIVHTLFPIGVAMAGSDEFDPYKD